MIKNKKILLFLISFVMIIFLSACDISNTTSSIPEETGTTSSTDITDDNNTNPSENDNKYTVTWKNWNGEVLEIDTNVEYGTMPEYNGDTPTRAFDQNNQYVFEKWNKEVTPVTGDTEYTAVFKSIAFTYCTVLFNSNGGSSVNPQSVLKGEKASKPANPTREGYTFDDWYYQGERWNFVGYTVTENMTLEAKWNINSYNLSLNKNISDAGTISNNIGLHNYNETITIRATTNPGYTFIGWYDGNNELTKDSYYSFNMPSNNLSYTARWAANTDTQYKVEHYLQNIDNDKYTIDTTETLYGETNTYTQASAKEYTGFNTPSVSQQIISGDGSTTIKLYYDRKICEITAKNNDNACKLTGIGKYKYGSDCTIQLTPYLGYTFDGIYINDEFVTKDLSYTIQNISDNIELEFKWLVLPELENFEFTSTVDTLKITGIKDRTITSITIPNSVTSIGDSAFEDCNSLTSIEIPDSVTWIGADAFFNCRSLTNITIPNNVTWIGDSAFSNCNSLTSITIPNRVTSIRHSAFSFCSALTSIEIPNSVTSIGDFAFFECYRLVEVINKSSISMTLGSTENGYVAYYAKQILKDESSSKLSTDSSGYVTYNDGEDICLINYVGTDTNITIPNSVTSIGDYAFFACSALTSIKIPNSVTSIGKGAFYICRSLTNITIPNSVISIGDYAFCNCSSLTSITTPNSVTSIGDSAFFECYRLVEVINKSSISMTLGSTEDGYVAYYAKQIIKDESGSKLSTDSSGYVTYNDVEDIWLINYVGTDTNIIIPNSITKINTSAFFGCIALINIEIPNSVTSIGDYAFYYCSSLTSITIPNSVTSIGDCAFSFCIALTSIEIPNSVTSIGDHAFSACSALTSIEIPNSVTSIRKGAFSGCSALTSIEIPNSVTSIGDYAFYGCSALTSIEIPNSVTSIGDHAFSDCESLTSIEIPNSVTSIEYGAFHNCSSLTSIEIPNSVTSIDVYAFYNCSSLTNIYYKGTQEEWNLITIDSSNYSFITGTICFYSEEEPQNVGNYWHYVDGVIVKW